MSDEEAAQTIKDMEAGEAAKILEEISNEKAARILELIEIERAIGILKNLSDLKASVIFEVMQIEKAAELLQEMWEIGLHNKTLTILCEISAGNVTAIFLKVEIGLAAMTLEAMVDLNVTRGADIIKNAASMNLTKTAKIVENMQTEEAAQLIIELSRRKD